MSVYKWEERAAALKHHCGVCETPLASTRGKVSCFEKHMEPCYKFHYHLHIIGHACACFICRASDEAHIARHREILVLLKQIEEAGYITHTLIKEEIDGSSQSSDPNPAQTKTPKRKKSKKAAKKLAKAAARPKITLSADLVHLDKLLHPGKQVGFVAFDTLLQAEANLMNRNASPTTDFINSTDASWSPADPGKIPRVVREKVLAQLDPELIARILDALGVPNTRSVVIPKKVTIIISALEKSIKEDLATVQIEDMGTRIRTLGFLKYAKNSTYNTIVKRNDFRDWRTGEILRPDQEDEGQEKDVVLAAAAEQNTEPVETETQEILEPVVTEDDGKAEEAVEQDDATPAPQTVPEQSETVIDTKARTKKSTTRRNKAMFQESLPRMPDNPFNVLDRRADDDVVEGQKMHTTARGDVDQSVSTTDEGESEDLTPAQRKTAQNKAKKLRKKAKQQNIKANKDALEGAFEAEAVFASIERCALFNEVAAEFFNGNPAQQTEAQGARFLSIITWILEASTPEIVKLVDPDSKLNPKAREMVAMIGTTIKVFRSEGLTYALARLIKHFLWDSTASEAVFPDFPRPSRQDGKRCLVNTAFAIILKHRHSFRCTCNDCYELSYPAMLMCSCIVCVRMRAHEVPQKYGEGGYPAFITDMRVSGPPDHGLHTIAAPPEYLTTASDSSSASSSFTTDSTLSAAPTMTSKPTSPIALSLASFHGPKVVQVAGTQLRCRRNWNSYAVAWTDPYSFLGSGRQGSKSSASGVKRYSVDIYTDRPASSKEMYDVNDWISKLCPWGRGALDRQQDVEALVSRAFEKCGWSVVGGDGEEAELVGGLDKGTK